LLPPHVHWLFWLLLLDRLFDMDGVPIPQYKL